MYDFAQFKTITPLIDARPGGLTPHRFTLTWSYPNYSTTGYTKIVLYRWIGAVGSCGFPSTFVPTDTVNNKYKILTIQTNISATSSFTDNLAPYYFGTSTGAPLHTIIGEPTLTDRQILDEVYITRRPIYYLLLTYARSGGFDTIPYVIPSHTDTGWMDNFSTKTQVKHNILRKEGNRMWATQLTSGGAKISRTAVDINRLYLDSMNHAGPTGRGGWAWVTGRGNDVAYKLELGTGKPYASYQCYGGNGNSGFGIAIDANTGDAYCGTYNPGSTNFFRCPSDGVGVNASREQISPAGYAGGNYGMTAQFGAPNSTTFYYSGRVPGFMSQVYRVIKQNGAWTATPICNDSDVYGIVSGPDGTIFWDSFSDSNISYYTLVGFCGNFSGILSPGNDNRGMACDQPGLYPNSTTQYNLYLASTLDGKVSRYAYNTQSKTLSVPGANNQWSASNVYGVGADSENNIWAVGSYITKIYRMSNNVTYPYGGRCRYPQLPLSAWPYSFTNTREIEWFLTRDQTLMDNHPSAAKPFPTPSSPIVTPQAAAILINEVGPYSGGLGGSPPVTENYWKYNNELYPGDMRAVFGTTVLGATQTTTLSTAVQLVNYWSELFGSDSCNIQGWELYPYYKIVGENNSITFYNNFGYSYEYSDFTGSVLVGAQTQAPVNYNIIHPQPTPLRAVMYIDGASQNAPLQESEDLYPWKTVTLKPTSSNALYVTGYDDLTVNFTGSAYPGTYVIKRWQFDFNDYATDYMGSPNTTNVKNIYTNTNYVPNLAYVTEADTSYTYHDTSKIGLTSNITNDPRSLDGTFMPRLSVFSTNNSYPDSPFGCAPVSAVASAVSVVVLERWPFARYFIQQSEVDHFSARRNLFNCPRWSNPERYHKNANYTIPTDKYTEDNIAYGVDPVSAKFFDRTIARTYPISTWQLTISTNCIWSDSITGCWTYTGDTYWPFISAISIEDVARLPGDTLNSEIRTPWKTLLLPGSAAVFRYGMYSATLDVNAAHSNTPSQNTWTEHLCVTEFEPFANFWAFSAMTVSPSYSDDTIGVYSSDVITNMYAMTPDSMHNFVSGYAPNLTVWFRDSSEGHTFPISSYHWNFGDYYDEYTNTLDISTVEYEGIFDSGCWRMSSFNVYNGSVSALVGNHISHEVKHTYVMPGIYDVTLCVQASNTMTQDCCARFTPIEEFYIYVREIPPSCCWSAWLCGASLSASMGGTSPITIYFNASCAIPGSFPVCRLDWDFDDGTPIETITRIPFATATKLGTPLISASCYIEDYTDPRNWIISHTYEVEGLAGSTFTPKLCVYACNTNTMTGPCTSIIVGPVSGPFVEIIETRHLINNRYINENNDLLYVFEGDTLNTAYTVVLSAV